MGIKSNRKGKAGERELANLLQDHLGIVFKRNLEQCREGGHDLNGLDRLSIEVKRANRPLIPLWWQQTCLQASQSSRVPVLAFRLDRRAWTFKMALRDVLEGFNEQEPFLEMTMDLHVEAFCAIVREKFYE